MRCFWMEGPSPGNLGDLVTPFLFREIALAEPMLCREATRGVLVGCGSVASKAREGSIVWGSGVIARDREPAGDLSKVRILCVRGPLTEAWVRGHGGLRDFPEGSVPWGDPALLLPKYIRPVLDEEHALTIVPHYTDLKRVRAYLDRTDPDGELIRVVDPLCGPSGFRKAVAAIGGSRIVASSSLHGIVVAVAYGVPAVWMRVGNDVIGDGFKFQDFWESVANNWALKTAGFVSLSERVDRSMSARDLVQWCESCSNGGIEFPGDRVSVDLRVRDLEESCPWK